MQNSLSQMRELQFLRNESIKNETFTYQAQAIEFITIGVGCNCLVALFEAGVLQVLLEQGYLSEANIESYSNPICIKSALTTLTKCQVLKKDETYQMTEFGRTLAENIGLVTIFFDGYGSLVAKQSQISRKKNRSLKNLINGTSVSHSSTLIAQNTIDPLILDEFANLKFLGTICDLGCGYATMLTKICKATGNPGLGFDSEPKVVKQAKKKLANSNISIEQGDITQLQGVWEDVVILMQRHVFHDFTPNERCIDIMNSYFNNFPNLKYFFYVDTVSPSHLKDELLPGFDYVHGLLGIQTRTYEETLQMFKDSNYDVMKEVSIPKLPNTFLWILLQKKSS